MHMTRRGFLAVAGIGPAAAALAACGAAATTAPAVEATTAPTEAVAAEATEAPAASTAQIELNWWVEWGEGVWGSACDNAARIHMEAYPNVKVNVLKGAAGMEKMLTAVAGGTPPDVMTSTFVPDLALRQALIPCDDMIDAAGIDRDNFFDAEWERASWEGVTYGLPAMECAFILAIGWNKNLFKEAGLDPDTAPTTWEELRSMSDAITKTDDAGNITIIGFRPLDAIGSELSCWDAITGSKLFDKSTGKWSFTHDEFIAAAEWFKGFYDAYGAENMAAFDTNFGTWTGSAQAGFTRGVQGLIINGYWMPGELQKLADPSLTFGYGWCPTYDGKTKIQLIGGHTNVIAKNAPLPQDSFNLMATVATDEVSMQTLEIAGGFMATKSFLEAVDKSRYPGLDWFLESGLAADVVKAEPNYPGFSMARDNWVAAFEEIGFGRKGIEEALTECEATVQASYDESVKA